MDPKHARSSIASAKLALAALVHAAILVSPNASAAHSPRTVAVGHSWDLSAVSSGQPVGVPGLADHAAIVGIGIAGSDDHVFVWYADGKVSSGTSVDFEYHQGKVDYALPDGKNPWDVVAMAIDGTNDHVVAYYADGTYSVGWSQDLGFHQGPQKFKLPKGKDVRDIVGVGSAGSDGRFYAFYADRTVSVGTASNLGAYEKPSAFSLPKNQKVGHIIDVAIAGSTDLVYTWFVDVEAGTGHKAIRDRVDAMAMDVLQRYNLPGMTVAASKNGRVVLEKGYGYRDRTAGARANPDSAGPIGSVSKIITTLSAMHLDLTRGDFDVFEKVYGLGGALQDPIYVAIDQATGIARHQPIVAKAIGPDDHVFTWNHDGTVTEGTSVDPDFYAGPMPYSLAPNMTAVDVRAIAIGSTGWAWVWYDDATFSAGTVWDLDAHQPRDAEQKVSFPGELSITNVVGVAIAPTNVSYFWFDDGQTCSGTPWDADANSTLQTYTVAPGKSRYDIRALGIAKSNSHVYTWLSDGTVIHGWSRDLDAYGGPNDYSVPAAAYDPAQDWATWYADMRVAHLLSHSAGFMRSGDVPGAEAMFAQPEDQLDYHKVHEFMLRTGKLLFEPGTDESYSNHGMGLVGHIVSVVSGESFHQYARTRIIDPLGLDIRSSHEPPLANDMSRHKIVDGIPESYSDDPTNDLGLAAGGWKASAGGLVRLMLATDRKSNHPDILPEPWLDKMETRYYPASGFALGWANDDKGKLDHDGLLGGGTTYVVKFAAGAFGKGSAEITVAVNTNIAIPDEQGASAPLRSLAKRIAEITSESAIKKSYDLY